MCSKKPKPPWSPQLAKAWAELHYYRLLASASKTNANYRPAIARLQQQWPHLPQGLEISNEQTIIQGKKAALEQMKQARQHAQQHREDFLLQKHANAIATDDTPTAVIIERILRAESQRNVYRKFNNFADTKLLLQESLIPSKFQSTSPPSTPMLSSNFPTTTTTGRQLLSQKKLNNYYCDGIVFILLRLREAHLHNNPYWQTLGAKLTDMQLTSCFQVR